MSRRVAKAQGFDFEIIYRKWKENVVANVLYKIKETSSSYSNTHSIHKWLAKAHHKWKTDNSSKQKNAMDKGMNYMEHCEWRGDIL